MDATEHPLWARLEAFQLDHADAELSFSERLARENGWSHEFALRVIDEYKRFIFLAMTAGHQVTPSDEVDQAWHLHLTYTRSYWNDLCGTLLKTPLHHGPTKGGKSEGVRFEDQYEQTLASYRQAFATEPPQDVWPDAATRFGDAPHFVRINRRRHLVWQKPRSARKRTAWMAGLIGVGTLGWLPRGWLPLAKQDDDSFFGFIALVAIALGIAILLSSSIGPGKRGGGRRGGSGCGTGGGIFGGPWFGGGDDDGGGSGCASSGCASSGCGGGGCGGGCGS